MNSKRGRCSVNLNTNCCKTAPDFLLISDDNYCAIVNFSEFAKKLITLQ